jgi:hypothetical protein
MKYILGQIMMLCLGWLTVDVYRAWESMSGMSLVAFTLLVIITIVRLIID